MWDWGKKKSNGMIFFFFAETLHIAYILIEDSKGTTILVCTAEAWAVGIVLSYRPHTGLSSTAPFPRKANPLSWHGILPLTLLVSSVAVVCLRKLHKLQASSAITQTQLVYNRAKKNRKWLHAICKTCASSLVVEDVTAMG